MGGKGSGGGVNPGQAREAYTNFSNYAGQAPGSDINNWTGYTGWASQNPSLAPYAQQGWNAGQSAAQSRNQMSGFMDALRGMQEDSSRQAEESAARARESSILANPNVGYEDVASVLGNDYGFVFDNSRWRPTTEEEFNTFAADREGTLNTYGGLITPGNSHIFQDWTTAIEGENSRDTLYSQYLDAAGAAADKITSELASERSNAALLGLKYDVTDEQKAQRINDYFATVWTGGQQTELEGLIKDFGDPEGFEGFTVTRGDASKYGANTTATEQVAVSRGIKPASPLDDTEEDTLGKAKSVLGG